jgi:hypothetical protein
VTESLQRRDKLVSRSQYIHLIVSQGTTKVFVRRGRLALSPPLQLFETHKEKELKNVVYSLTTAALLGLATLSAAAQNTTFNMVRSAGAEAANCIPNAKGRVTINSLGNIEVLHLEATGLPPKTEFDAFVTQLPNAPFGLSWYQGDLTTDETGKGVADFIGRFSIETFIVAPGSGPAPVIHAQDASSNPATAPVHTFHVGLWFGSSVAASAATCPATMTPFNGDHTAGIQALSTRNFPDVSGPLKRIH